MDRLIGVHGVHDPVVIETLIGEYGAPVYRLAFSILRDPDDAQDAAQETFIQAAVSLHQYQLGTNFKAWLFRIAVNTCRMTLRKRSVRRIWSQTWETIANLVPRQTETESQVIQDETRSELWKLVDHLDEKYRLVVLLRLVHDLKVSEISQVLGINEKTVYTRLYEAFARLRVKLQARPEFAHLWEEAQS